MTDRPLDCQGIPLTAQVGKHDFRRIPRSDGYQCEPGVQET